MTPTPKRRGRPPGTPKPWKLAAMGTLATRRALEAWARAAGLQGHSWTERLPILARDAMAGRLASPKPSEQP